MATKNISHPSRTKLLPHILQGKKSPTVGRNQSDTGKEN